MPSSPMRIALISEHASPLATIGSVDAGGQNIYVSHVARELARAGHQVDVLTRRDSPALPSCVHMRPGVRVLHIPAGPSAFVPKERLLAHMPAFTESARRLMQHSVRYDVVHANFFMSGLVGLRLKETFKTPLVMTFHALGRVRREHQGDSDAFPPMRIQIEERLVAHADRLIAECPQDELDLVRLYDASAERIATVPCGVDPDEFSPVSGLDARRALGIAADEFVVLQLGRLVPRKGIDNVIRAVAMLPPRVKARLLIVGGETREPDEHATPEIGRLGRLAQSLGVADRVTFAGHRQRAELRECYAAADVFVTTPWYEPFGITPLEAMACGKPVLGSAVGGIQYSVQDGVTGYLVPPRDATALSIRLLQLHENPALAQAMGRAGMRRVRSRFTWDRVAAELADVYQDVCQPGLVDPVVSRPLHRAPPASLAQQRAGLNA